MLFDFLVAVVILHVAATISLWQAAARRPEKPKKKFIVALLHSGPITPQHQSPKEIGNGSTSLITDEDRRFFKDFDAFAEVVNWWFAEADGGSPWRLQELPDTGLRLWHSDQPMFGRRYSIFHNQVRLGRLEVSPGYKYSAERPNVHMEIELEYVRLLHYDDISDFLSEIAMHVCDTRDTEERFQSRMNIESALTAALWQTQHISEYEGLGEDYYGDLRLQLNGSAVWYFVRRSAPGLTRWKNGKVPDASRG